MVIRASPRAGDGGGAGDIDVPDDDCDTGTAGADRTGRRPRTDVENGPDWRARKFDFPAVPLITMAFAKKAPFWASPAG